MKCDCDRFRDADGLAPCPVCAGRNLVRMAIGEGRFTYRCNACYPITVLRYLDQDGVDSAAPEAEWEGNVEEEPWVLPDASGKRLGRSR
jgi:hypothetical protein